MSEKGPTTTTTPAPNYPAGSTAEKIQQIVASGGNAQVKDIESPGVPPGATPPSGRPPKKVIDANGNETYAYYMPNDDANFLLTNMNPFRRDQVLKMLYERGQYGGAQRGNGLNSQDIGAMADLLYYANGKGLPWDQALVEYQRDFKVNPKLLAGAGRRAPVQVSNTDDIKAIFKKASQDLLGRAVDDKIAESFVNMVQAQQRAQQQQLATQSGGVVEQTADVSTLARKQIESQFAVEQRIQNAANAASIIDNLVKGLAR